jgi:RHS repeat-associated protein
VRNLIDGSGAVVGAADYSAFGEYRNQTGVTSRFGFTGEYYAQETGMWHLRARDLHPSLGRFLSADPVQPNAPGTQGYNRYAYVANNPTTWVDPSGYSVEPLAADQALLGMMYAMPRSLHAVLCCALSEECGDLQALMKKLGSRGANFMVWTAEELQKAFFSTYPHQPTPVDPGLLVLSMGLSNTPILGDLYDLYTGAGARCARL